MLQLKEKDQSELEVERPTELESDLEPAENELLTTPDVLPIKGVGRGCLALAGGGFSVIGKLEGQYIKLMSFQEKSSIVRRVGSIFNNMPGPFAFYCVSNPRDMRSYLTEL